VNDNEKEIIRTVIEGDSEPFSRLVHAHQARVRLACLVRLGHLEEANDAAQEVFVKAFKALAHFKGDSSFLTWILRIADNHCLDLLRSRGRRRMESLDALLVEKGDAFEGLLSGSRDEPRAHTPQDLELLGRLFAALSEEDREILALREVEEMSYEDIAEKLHCSLDAVKGRLKRARQILLEKCGKFFQTQH
jgi:RNA polymerase sigma-70 factor, ECF subfamily